VLKSVFKGLIQTVGTVKTSTFGICPKCGFHLKLVSSPFGGFILCSNPKCDYFEKVNIR